MHVSRFEVIRTALVCTAPRTAHARMLKDLYVPKLLALTLPNIQPLSCGVWVHGEVATYLLSIP